MGFSAVLLVGCAGAAAPNVSLMDDEQAQVEVPSHIEYFIDNFYAIEVGQDHDDDLFRGQDLENFTLIEAGEDFSVFAARDNEDNWCVVLDNKPLAEHPDDWTIGVSCASSENFSADGIRLQIETPTRMHTAQLLPDDFTGDIPDDLERINDNLAAR